MRISDWSSDVCSSDLEAGGDPEPSCRLLPAPIDAKRVRGQLVDLSGKRLVAAGEFADAGVDCCVVGICRDPEQDRQDNSCDLRIESANDDGFDALRDQINRAAPIIAGGAWSQFEVRQRRNDFAQTGEALADRKSTRLNSSH